MNKHYDIIVFGATGCTGGLVAEYLLNQASPASIALAGRSLKKLNKLKKSLLKSQKDPVDIGIIKANVTDQASVVSMTSQGKVVANVVGPYIRYGEPVVRACIETQTHYLDISNEVEFVDYVFHKYHESAQIAGIKVVNCCGFDSIPHDLGALFAITELSKQVEGDIIDECISMEGFVSGDRYFSDGSWHAAIDAFSHYRQYKKIRKYWYYKDHNGLPTSNRKIKALPFNIQYQDKLNAWSVPLPTIGSKIVLRSARRMPIYGERFEYGHYKLFKQLPKALKTVVSVGSVFSVAQFRKGKKLLLTLRKKRGEPHARQHKKDWFCVTVQARSSQDMLEVQVQGSAPDNSETAKMLGESALCLAFDGLSHDSGVLTPAVGMGMPLIKRLHGAGVTFNVLESGKHGGW